MPTTLARTLLATSGAAVKVSVTNATWNEYKTRVAARYQTQDMRWQLERHAYNAPTKSSWNLDTFIHRGSNAQYVASACS